MIFNSETEIPYPKKLVSEWFLRKGAFSRLIPPFQNIQFNPNSDAVSEGSINQFSVKENGLSLSWTAKHSRVIPGKSFIDEQLTGPFKQWRHTHLFEETTSGTLLKDEVQWEGPFLESFTPIFKRKIENTLIKTFAFRKIRLENDLRAHFQYQNLPRLKIGITGASGVIGSALSAFLTTGGHEVSYFVRRPSQGTEIFWNPKTGEIESDKVRELDAVIHLAGENVSKKGWSNEFKKEILESRVKGTELIVRTLSSFNDRPRTLVSASAIGIYGDTGSQWASETSDSGGKTFLSKVCQEWESPVLKSAENKNLRTAIARIGVVLTLRGGALHELALPTKMGLGGKIGSGAQYMSWIALDDVLYSLYQILMEPQMNGIYNLVSPASLTQAEFARTLAKTLKRPSIFKIPAFAIRTLFGEMGEEVLLQGQRVKPERLIEARHDFAFADLEKLLKFEFGL